MFIIRLTCFYVILNVIAVYGTIQNTEVTNEQQEIIRMPNPKTEPFYYVSFLGDGDQLFRTDLIGSLGKGSSDQNNIVRSKRQEDPAAAPTNQDIAALESANYEVKYKTKFAFQNVDNATDKLIKYNRSENVYYGNNYKTTTILPVVRSLHQNSEDGHQHEDSNNNWLSLQANMKTLEKFSIEMQKCHKMPFTREQREQQLPGLCALCRLSEKGVKSIEACPKIDCDVFAEVNEQAIYPICCPSCK